SLIFPSVPGSAFWLFHPMQKVSFSPNLKPGIDMVGGTSLLYEIKQPEGGYHGQAGHTLAEQVMESLKKRVDPDGVRNLIWRPQGNTRLEIQMPLAGKNEKSKERREAFDKAQGELDATNARMGAVVDAVEHLKGDDRTKKLNELAMDSQARKELSAKLVQNWDQIQSIKAAHDPTKAAQQADLEDEYEKLKSQLE